MLQVMIDVNGFLSVNKAGKMVNQFCPNGYNNSRCGDWCPMFDTVEIGNSGQLQAVEIQLCQTTINTDLNEFSDERNHN